MIEPIASPVSNLKYLKRLNNGGELGNKPKLNANTRVRNANESILNPSIITVPARMKLWKSNNRRPVFTGPKKRMKLAVAPAANRITPGYKNSQRGL